MYTICTKEGMTMNIIFFAVTFFFIKMNFTFFNNIKQITTKTTNKRISKTVNHIFSIVIFENSSKSLLFLPIFHIENKISQKFILFLFSFM